MTSSSQLLHAGARSTMEPTGTGTTETQSLATGPWPAFSSGAVYDLLDELPSRRWLMDAVRTVVAEPVAEA